MSKILLINGSPNEKGCTYTALAEIAATLHEQGVETEMIWLGKKPVQDCIACHSCMKTGRCVFADIVNETADKLARHYHFNIVGFHISCSLYSSTRCALGVMVAHLTDTPYFLLARAASMVT